MGSEDNSIIAYSVKYNVIHENAEQMLVLTEGQMRRLLPHLVYC